MRFLIGVMAVLFSVCVYADDWEGTVTVKYEGKNMFVSTQKYFDMTPNQVADLQKRGQAVLDHAARNQDRGGPYTIVWEQRGQPAIETQGLQPNALVSVVRQMNKWNTTTVDHMEVRRQKGAKKLWGK